MTQTAEKRPSAQQRDSRPELKIAVSAMISPETTRDYYEELLRLIADRMGRKAVFIQRRSYAEVNALIKNRQVDFAFVCSGPYTQGHAEFGMELLAVPVVHGESVYHAYIIAHRDSPLRSFDELKGHKFAFTDPHSNTGCLVPTYMLAQRGTTPKAFFKESFFSRSHDNSIKAVAEGLSDGAAVDSLIWEFMQTINPGLTSQTRIIEKSPAYGIPPIVVHPDLDPAIKKQLRKIFLTLDQDPQARTILAKLQIERFSIGDDASYDTVREMSRWLEKHPVQ
jgi:phosphonate transport system substrate-binding protein